MLGLFLVVYILGFSRGVRGFFRRLWPGGLLLVAPVIVPPAAMVTGAVPPVVPPLPGAGLSLRGPWLLPCLLLWCLRWLLTGIVWLRVFFCHNCQTD